MVNAILLQDGKAIGVELKDGRKIKADVVIHNAGLNRLVEMVGKENLPENYAQHLSGAIPANVAALILGTKTPLLGEEHSLLHTIGLVPHP